MTNRLPQKPWLSNAIINNYTYIFHKCRNTILTLRLNSFTRRMAKIVRQSIDSFYDTAKLVTVMFVGLVLFVSFMWFLKKISRGKLWYKHNFLTEFLSFHTWNLSFLWSGTFHFSFSSERSCIKYFYITQKRKTLSTILFWINKIFIFTG